MPSLPLSSSTTACNSATFCSPSTRTWGVHKLMLQLREHMIPVETFSSFSRRLSEVFVQSSCRTPATCEGIWLKLAGPRRDLRSPVVAIFSLYVNDRFFCFLELLKYVFTSVLSPKPKHELTQQTGGVQLEGGQGE